MSPYDLPYGAMSRTPRNVVRPFPSAKSKTRGGAWSLALLVCSLWLAQPCAATPGEWAYTGKLNMRRSGGGSVLLLDGRAMVVGAGASVEIYDQATGTWTL